MHIHGIKWTNENLKEVQEKWGYGWVWKGKEVKGKIINYVSEQTINYITKYVYKQDYDHKEYKAKILTSPGIGNGYMKRSDWKRNKYGHGIFGDTREYYQTKTGHKIALPVYYRNKIYSEDEREKLWIDKLDKQERWVGGEKIDISKGEKEYYATLEFHRERNRRLGYGNVLS